MFSYTSLFPFFKTKKIPIFWLVAQLLLGNPQTLVKIYLNAFFGKKNLERLKHKLHHTSKKRAPHWAGEVLGFT